ncbi:MAG: transposase [Bryobacteraceae bacterium]
MESHRRLPHIYPADKALFITFNLHGSVPASGLPPPGPLPSGRAFVWIDKHLDAAKTGPRHMLRSDLARLVATSIRKGAELRHYDLEAFVVMPNHVHMLIWPKISPSRLMNSLKGSTARAANKVLGLTGEPFWQKESYDHWVRNDEELRKIHTYIDDNPVRAGLVADAREYPWSSAGGETSLAAARMSPCVTPLSG